MKISKLFLLFFLLLSKSLYAIDAKLTELPELTTPSNDDLLYIVDDPSGTDTSRKITFSNLMAPHLNDAIDAHDASAISNAPSGNLAATDVQGALNELQSDIDTRALSSAVTDHLNDTTDAHDASAISNVPSGNLAATDVQGALNELQTDIDNHLSDTTDAHDASAISSVAAGNLSATDVQAALNELDTEKAGLATNNTLSGTNRFTGTIESDAVSPAQITADQNDYAGCAGKEVCRLSSDATRIITSIAGGGNWRWLEIWNIGSTESIILEHESASGTATNRIISVSASNLTMQAGQGAMCRYDNTSTRWRCVLLRSHVTAEVDTLNSVFARTNGNRIDGAIESKPFSLRGTGAGSNDGWDFFTDSTNTPQFKCVINDVQDDCDYMRQLLSGKKAGFKNSSSSDLFAVYESGITLLKAKAASSTPAAGYGSLYVDSTSKKLCNKDDAGVETCTAGAASTTASGIVELAIASEVDTGTDATRAVTPDSLAGSTVFGRKVVQMTIFDIGTTITTGDKKGIFVVPVELNGMNLVAVSAHVDTVSSSGAITIDLARCAVVATGNTCSGTVVDMLSTNLTIDANESKSSTAAAAVIDTANDDVATDQVIRVDVDAAGTGAAGLFLTMSFQLP